jgi:hypothetical protein
MLIRIVLSFSAGVGLGELYGGAPRPAAGDSSDSAPGAGMEQTPEQGRPLGCADGSPPPGSH